MNLSFRYNDIEQALNEKKDIECLYVVEKYHVLKSNIVLGECEVFIEIEVEKNGFRQTKTGDS